MFRSQFLAYGMHLLCWFLTITMVEDSAICQLCAKLGGTGKTCQAWEWSARWQKYAWECRKVS
jgi:hypothetical protein